MTDFRSDENPRRGRIGRGERDLKGVVVLPAVKIAGYGRFANKVEPNVELARIDGCNSQYRRLTGIGIRLLAGGVVDTAPLRRERKSEIEGRAFALLQRLPADFACRSLEAESCSLRRSKPLLDRIALDEGSKGETNVARDDV